MLKLSLLREILKCAKNICDEINDSDGVVEEEAIPTRNAIGNKDGDYFEHVEDQHESEMLVQSYVEWQ